MDTTNIFILGGTVLALLLLWIIVGARHLKYLRKNIQNYWEKIDEHLRKRQSMIPILTEIVRQYYVSDDQFTGLINARMKAIREMVPGAKKIEYEHDVTTRINEIMALEKTNQLLAKEANFLIIKQDMESLEKTIEDMTKEYNEIVRKYNSHRDFIILRVLAGVFRYQRADIFEFEI